MAAFVVDVNVCISANGRHNATTLQHIQQCIKALSEAKNGLICLDNGDYILKEYRKHLSMSGQPGVGDEFMQWTHQNQYNEKHCERVSITVSQSDENDFEEFPKDSDLLSFDRSDRKYVAVAVSSKNSPEILNATDTHWWRYRKILERNGVRIRFICPELMKDSR